MATWMNQSFFILKIVMRFGMQVILVHWELQTGWHSKKNLIVRGVYGNVDGYDIRSLYPEELAFSCEDVNVLIIHIGGYPPKYNSQSKARILFHKPALFITGHSHILKIMFDETNQCLYMNPGAAGKQGYHKVRTIVRFTIDGKIIKDCEVIELGKRG